MYKLISRLDPHCRMLATVATLLVVTCLYWPVHDAGFVGAVDKAYFHDFAWLRSTEHWYDVFFHHKWSAYFRPFVVGLFAIEERAFDVAPGPMHLVSLGLHLANTALVGALCLRFLEAARSPWQRCMPAALAMLLYGVHPGLTESVASVSCQFELVVVFFTLLGLLLNTSIHHRIWRAVGVGSCFFLAACSKESAVVFPLLVAVFDWMLVERTTADDSIARVSLRIAKQQWPVYAAMLFAGAAYLVLRHQSLGFLVDPDSSGSVGLAARLQMAAWLLVTYWRIFLWPMTGLGPVHEVDTSHFASFTAMLAITDGLAILVTIAGIWLFLKRRPAGALIIGVSAALLPVLHLVPVEFDSSLYHERYAMMAISVGCVLLPGALVNTLSVARRTWVRACIMLAVVTWLSIAAANVRVTLPLWSDETRLWLWVVAQNPQSVLAKNHLLGAYLERGDLASAQRVADALVIEGRFCPVCLVNVANLALSTGDAAAAHRALDQAAPLVRRVNQVHLQEAFVIATAQLHELEHRPDEALEDYRKAVTLEPMDPRARMQMALLLAQKGMLAEANIEAERALALMAPDERQESFVRFKRALETLGPQSPPIDPLQ